jgi:formamidopyrimidine-DNA glycosylase
MPELPEVETVRLGLAPALEGARLTRVETRRPDLRWPFPERFVERLEGRRVEALRRRAKYLLADLDSGETLIMHLGMSGSFRVEDAAEAGQERTPGRFHHARGTPGAHDHVVIETEAGARVTYQDPRRFGFMDLAPTRDLARCKHFVGMGVEPLEGTLDGPLLTKLFAGKAAPLKAALLDQKGIAGLGNIYVCEALHRAGLSPKRAAGQVSGPQARRLAEAIGAVLAEAVEAGGSSLRDHRRTDGELGYFQHSFRVYDREGAACPTPGCSGVILRVAQSGRSTFFCAACQK